MVDGTAERQWVGIDLHLHRSVICRLDDQGNEIGWVRIDNDPKALVRAVRKAGRRAPVAIEATYGWYWAVDALMAAKFEVHLAHPYGMKAMRSRRRVKTDQRDARELANLLRLGSLPEAYIAPPQLRELRELVRYRMVLTKANTAVKNGIRAVLAKHGIRLPVTDLECQRGTTMLDAVGLPGAYADRLASQRRCLLQLEHEIGVVETQLDRMLRPHPGYRSLLKIQGLGPVLAGIFVAEIGDISRFPTADALACWAGITPRLHASDLTVRHGHVSKQGSGLVRWAASRRCSANANPACGKSVTRSSPAAAVPSATSPRSRPRTGCSIWSTAPLRDGQARALRPAAA